MSTNVLVESGQGPNGRLRRRVLERPEAAAFVLSKCIDGLDDRAIAAAMPAYWPATERQVANFRQRHAAEIAAAKHELMVKAADVAIANREERLRQYDGLNSLIDAWIEANGLNEVRTRYDKDGNVVGETLTFNAAVTTQKRAVLRDVAEEMGDISRAAKVQVNVDNRQIRVYDVGLEGGSVRTPRAAP